MRINVRNVIKKTQEEYQYDDAVRKSLPWEMMKLKIREQAIKYASAKKAKISRREEELEREINLLQNYSESNQMKQNEKNQGLWLPGGSKKRNGNDYWVKIQF